MNDSPQPRQPGWIPAALVAVLAAQVGLLWLHGGMLNRQHSEIQAMRQDIQELTEALDGYTNDQGADTEEGSYQPASSVSAIAPIHRHRHRRHRRHNLQRVSDVSLNAVLQESQETTPPPDDQEPGRKEMEAARESAKKAVSQSYGVQQKLSISENIRKAEEKKKIEAATSNFLPVVYGAMFLGVVAFIAGRMWRARSGGR